MKEKKKIFFTNPCCLKCIYMYITRHKMLISFYKPYESLYLMYGGLQLPTSSIVLQKWVG